MDTKFGTTFHVVFDVYASLKQEGLIPEGYIEANHQRSTIREAIRVLFARANRICSDTALNFSMVAQRLQKSLAA